MNSPDRRSPTFKNVKIELSSKSFLVRAQIHHDSNRGEWNLVLHTLNANITRFILGSDIQKPMQTRIVIFKENAVADGKTSTEIKYIDDVGCIRLMRLSIEGLNEGVLKIFAKEIHPEEN